MLITLKIFRYNPEVDTKAHYETYTLEGEETDRVLDLLEKVKGYNDGTLSFRRSCAHGVCGSDALRVNGRNMLACKTLVRDVGVNITVEPLLGLKIIKDLIVDMDPFFDNYKKILPYFINESPLPADGKERLQSPSCPSFWASDDYLGPAALVTAHRFIFDSRDESASERLHIVSETSGIARCHTAFNCTMACPREIQITRVIGELKMATITGKVE
jgi:succinate dehydrogenase / fumarate reductase iron-sulfur subunit